jgi:hypothetical protein
MEPPLSKKTRRCKAEGGQQAQYDRTHSAGRFLSQKISFTVFLITEIDSNRTHAR